MPTRNTPLVLADNEWSSLRSVIVGRADNSCFPSEPAHMIQATMPDEHQAEFKPRNPFNPSILEKANEELDQFAAALEREGLQYAVCKPSY
jgi:glycine amidinotransferase